MATSITNSNQFITLTLENRDDSGHVSKQRQTFSTSELAIIVMDVWDSHPDPVEASRVAALIPRINQTLAAARQLGIQVIFSPNEVPLPSNANTNVFQTLTNETQLDDDFAPPTPSLLEIRLGRHGPGSL